jgi:hypothetical protein
MRTMIALQNNHIPDGTIASSSSSAMDKLQDIDRIMPIFLGLKNKSLFLLDIN